MRLSPRKNNCITFKTKTLIGERLKECLKEIEPGIFKYVSSRIDDSTIAAEFPGVTPNNVQGVRRSLFGQMFTRRSFDEQLAASPPLAPDQHVLPLDRIKIESLEERLARLEQAIRNFGLSF